MVGRPRYETVEDVANERAVVGVFASLFPGAEATRLSDEGHAFTVLAKNGRPRIAVEIKTRRNSSYQYPTFMISKRKYDALCALNAKGLRTGMLVQWTDRLGYVSVPVEHRTKMGGRYDRGDSKDIEVVVLIDVDKFQTIRSNR
jgi:hypothetical protein